MPSFITQNCVLQLLQMEPPVPPHSQIPCRIPTALVTGRNPLATSCCSAPETASCPYPASTLPQPLHFTCGRMQQNSFLSHCHQLAKNKCTFLYLERAGKQQLRFWRQCACKNIYLKCRSTWNNYSGFHGVDLKGSGMETPTSRFRLFPAPKSSRCPPPVRPLEPL